jgi:hypothetical protein
MLPIHHGAKPFNPAPGDLRTRRDYAARRISRRYNVGVPLALVVVDLIDASLPGDRR